MSKISQYFQHVCCCPLVNIGWLVKEKFSNLAKWEVQRASESRNLCTVSPSSQLANPIIWPIVLCHHSCCPTKPHHYNISNIISNTTNISNMIIYIWPSVLCHRARSVVRPNHTPSMELPIIYPSSLKLCVQRIGLLPTTETHSDSDSDEWHDMNTNCFS